MIRYNRSPRNLAVQETLLKLQDELKKVAWDMTSHDLASREITEKSGIEAVHFYRTRDDALKIARQIVVTMTTLPQYDKWVDTLELVRHLRQQFHPGNTFGVGSNLLYDACNQLVTRQYAKELKGRYEGPCPAGATPS